MSILQSPLDMMKALMLVLMDPPVNTDVIFIHGPPVTDEYLNDDILDTVTRLLHSGLYKEILINGTPDDLCREKTIAYPGKETYLKKLQERGVTKVLLTPIALHTATECHAVLDLAVAHKWKSVTLFSMPHHIPRCMMQMVYFMEQRRVTDLKVHARTLDSVYWQGMARKPLIGGGVIDGLLFDHIEEEQVRIDKYADRDGTGYTPHATLPQLIAYMRWRDAVAVA